jgi:digalactosyldiacylglycerol synthase
MKAPSPDAGTLPEEPPRGASNDNVEVTASNQMILAPCSQDDVGDNNGKELLPPQPTAASNMANLNRRICIVTTAALPWRTGTAVNPLLRALALTRGRPPHFVTLWLPWLADAKAQQQLYGQPFASRADQEAWIRDYCRTRADGAGR